MKLYKALKLKKKLIGEIIQLKKQIEDKNSYIIGTVNPNKYDVDVIYNNLLKKINQLVSLKYMINEANREIQSKIYILSEYKSLISFWNGVNVKEGSHPINYSELLREHNVQFDEEKRDSLVRQFQEKIDAIQDEIDTYNHMIEIPLETYTDEE